MDPGAPADLGASSDPPLTSRPGPRRFSASYHYQPRNQVGGATRRGHSAPPSTIRQYMCQPRSPTGSISGAGGTYFTPPPTTETQHLVKHTNYFLLLVGLVGRILSAILGDMTARWQGLGMTIGLVWVIAMPLALNVVVWSTFFGLTDFPLVTLWPNKFIVELLIPWVVNLRTSNGPSACYGYITGLIMTAIAILLIRIARAVLRWLSVPTRRGSWGCYRSMQSILTASAGWRMYNYYLHYLELASNERWSYTQCLLNFLQPPALRYFQRRYCPRVKFFLTNGFNFPLCATATLGSYNWNSEPILLPWTQHSLTDRYLLMTGQKRDDPNPLEAMLLWINYGLLYFYFFEIFPYSSTVLPKQFLEAAIVRKPRILAFASFQLLRFTFNILPRLILDFPSLILRPIQYPFRHILKNTHLGTRFVVGVMVYLGFINCWELWMFLYFFPPQDEWELQPEFIVVKAFTYICGVVLYSAYWLIWYKEWSRYVMWPEQRVTIELLQMVRGPRIDEFRRVLGYWDGFWRYDERNRRGSSLEYSRGFNLSSDFCRFILCHSAVWAVYGWYLNCTVIIMRYLAQMLFSQPMTFELTWEWVFWRLVAPSIFCWVVDDTFFGEGKIDRMSFILPKVDDLETF